MPTSRRPQRALLPHPIGHTLRTLARWAVATSLSASGACATQHEDAGVGQTVPPSMPQPGSWQGVTCEDNFPRLFAEPLQLTREVDYLGLYVSNPPALATSWPAMAVLFDAQGTRCAASIDRATCE